MRSSARLTTVLAALAVAAASLTVVTAAPSAGALPTVSTGSTSVAAASGWRPRPAQYPKTVTRANLPIRMDDGVVLRGDLILPADKNGKAIPGKFPVIVTITAYNKSVQQYAGGLAGGAPEYLVRRGYAQLTVDARGTGNSAGVWCAFCTRENNDGALIMRWAHRQAWSNGNTGMAGPSYMGIAQMFAAAGHPAGLKAIFPQVPAGDVYRDVVASGGQLDVGFIPLWLGLVNFTGLIPPATAPDATALSTIIEHLTGNGAFTLQLLLKALGGGEPAYDGPFYKQRSPLTVVNKVNVPTFFVSGEYDLFQRGTPLLFENLQKRGVPTKLIIGPWNHLQASGGEDVGKAGLGSLNELKLRWFDHYVKGKADPALNADIPPLTYYEQGTGAWRHGGRWLANRKAVNFRLSGTAKAGGRKAGLARSGAKAGTSSVLPIPVAGVCTKSTDQWTAGILGAIGDGPCLKNNAANDKAGVVFRTAPVSSPIVFQGPLNARLYVSSLSGDGMLSVAVEDEGPNGVVKRISGGWQVVSQRKLDRTRSRSLDGSLLQAFHPFTKASEAPLKQGTVQAVDVEIFPTAARIRPGHRLRIAVQAWDVPHLFPTLPQLLGSLTVLTIHNSAKYPSVLTVPVVK